MCLASVWYSLWPSHVRRMLNCLGSRYWLPSPSAVSLAMISLRLTSWVSWKLASTVWQRHSASHTVWSQCVPGTLASALTVTSASLRSFPVWSPYWMASKPGTTGAENRKTRTGRHVEDTASSGSISSCFIWTSVEVARILGFLGGLMGWTRGFQYVQ